VQKPRWISLAVVAGLTVVGCGGDRASATVSGPPTGTFAATQTDGTQLFLEVQRDAAPHFFADLTWTPPGAPAVEHIGSCRGTFQGLKVSANVEEDAMNPTDFQLVGNYRTDGYDLTRSDLPGAVLHFSRVATSASTRGTTVSFTLNFDSKSSFGTGVVSATLVRTDGTFRYYEGTWRGFPIKITGGPSNTRIIIETRDASGVLITARVFGDFPIKDADLGKGTATGGRGVTYVTASSRSTDFHTDLQDVVISP